MVGDFEASADGGLEDAGDSRTQTFPFDLGWGPRRYDSPSVTFDSAGAYHVGGSMKLSEDMQLSATQSGDSLRFAAQIRF